jgi:hypothetical protein
MLTVVSDLLDRIRSELDDRVAALKPAVEEFTRLQRAADALDRTMAPPAAAPAASPSRPATRRRAPSARRSGSVGKVTGRAAPGATQLRVIEQLRNEPGSSSTAVAEALGISANAAAATISRLVKQNRVTRLKTGGYEAAVAQPAEPASADAPEPEPGSGSGSG